MHLWYFPPFPSACAAAGEFLPSAQDQARCLGGNLVKKKSKTRQSRPEATARTGGGVEELARVPLVLLLAVLALDRCSSLCISELLCQ
jgi:hypothetical protein